MRINTNTLSVTHVFDGEEIVTGGEDGQTWVATFGTAMLAQMFVTSCQRSPWIEVAEPTEFKFSRRYVPKT